MNSYERKALKHIFSSFENQFNKSVIVWEEDDYEAVAKEIKTSTGKHIPPFILSATVRAFINDSNSLELADEIKENLPIYFQKNSWEELVNHFAYEIHQPKKISFKDIPKSFWRSVLYLLALFAIIKALFYIIKPD